MMMRTRSGFTLVELLVVTLLTALVLGGVYQTLIVQEKSFEAAGLVIHDQEALRTAAGILEAELREIGSIGGPTIGGTDIATAGPGTITFRAQRKIGFICDLSRGEKWARVWTLSDPFEADDRILVFADGDSLRYTDDRWDSTLVSNAADDSDSACEAQWPGMPIQLLKLESTDLTDVRMGSPIRAYEWVTYSLTEYSSLGWALSRHIPGDDDRPDYLVGGLAPPGEGLEFTYFAPDGAETTDPANVARLEFTIRTDPKTNTSVQSAELTSALYLRNN